MGGLSREVIKWLQSLDLGISIKNVKWDFANGYIVALIFSKYYPDEITPWLLYTGNSYSQKSNNWGVIEKFFMKRNINIPRDAIDAVMNCQNDAAIQFVENIYTLLTGRYIKHLPSTLDETEIIPHFALPTTANAIKYMAKSPEKARIVLEAHTEFLKQLRIQRKDEIKKIMIQQKRTLEPLKEVVVSQKTHIKVKQI